MGRKKSWGGAGDKRDGGAFMTIPMSVIDSTAYLRASAHARMLLWDMFSQYRGGNNGDLCAAWKIMRNRGWKSEDTLARAKRQLLDLQLIVETRKGARPNKASLYAVTWCALDECGGKLELPPSQFPRGHYKLLNPLPPIRLKNTSLNTPSVVGNPLIAPEGVVVVPSTTPIAASINT